MISKGLVFTVFSIVTLLGTAVPARADLIQLNEVQLTGQGIGAQLTVLTLQNGSSPTESGRVEYTGGAFAPTGDASTGASQWNTFNFTDLGITNANQLALTVNLSEPGSEDPPSVTVTSPYQISLYAYTSTGTLLETFVCTTCGQLLQVAGGVGGSGIVLGLTGPEAAALNAIVAANPGYVLTAGASFTGAQGGNDVIQAVRLAGSVPVPEPTSLLLFGSGLTLFARWTTSKRKT